MKTAVLFVTHPSPQERIFLLYVIALCLHFLLVPSANWYIYSVHFLLPVAFWLTYLLDRGPRRKLNAPVASAICVLLIIPIVREYHFLDKAGVLIPCGLFLMLIIASKFCISHRLILTAMLVFTCVHLLQLHTNHVWYRKLSAVLTSTNHTRFVTDPIFEFLGPQYDIRIMGLTDDLAAFAESRVLLLDRVQFRRSGLTRKPDQHFRFNNHFIPRIYQEWFLFLPSDAAPADLPAPHVGQSPSEYKVPDSGATRTPK